MGLVGGGYVSFPLAAIGVCWVYRTRPPVTEVRLSCECGLAGPRVVFSYVVAVPGAITEETDGCAGTVQIRGVWRGGADATGLCAEAPIHTSGF